jgi:hypothetical protein
MKGIAILLLVLLVACKTPRVFKAQPKPTSCFTTESFNMTQRKSTELLGKKKPIVQPQPPPSCCLATWIPPGVILLDFDGYTVTGTSWNYSGDITCAPSGLTSDEQQRILDTVALHYRPYNVIVTTNDSVYYAASKYKRTRCIITETYQWYGQAAGTSFINSMSWGSDTPCFVFSLLVNYSTKRIQEVATHEIGHTIGLRHQSVWTSSCTLQNEYNPGNDTSSFIMGDNRVLKKAIWWTGTNNVSCTTIQNDSLIIKVTLSK